MELVTLSDHPNADTAERLLLGRNRRHGEPFHAHLFRPRLQDMNGPRFCSFSAAFGPRTPRRFFCSAAALKTTKCSGLSVLGSTLNLMPCH
jgi:hypothetical protein